MSRLSSSDFRNLVKASITHTDELDAERQYLVQRAPNIIEWVARKEFLDQPSIYEFYGAYTTLRDFFELRCPFCNDHIPKKIWTPGDASSGLPRSVLESEVLLTWNSKYEDDACPKCNVTRMALVEEGLFNNHRVLHLILGQRAGKSTLLAMVGTYIEHVLLGLAHSVTEGLSGYFGTAQGDGFDISYVASTEDQGDKTIWAKYRKFRRRSPWFGRYVPWIKQLESVQDTPEGMQPWRYNEADKFIKNGKADLTIDTLNSNSNGIAGRTRVFAAIDEICRMLQTDGARSGEEIYRTMMASCQTVVGQVDNYGLVPWLGMIASISSPMAVEDYGMQLLAMAKEDKRMYTEKWATWDYNPEQPFHLYEAMLKKDRVGTMRNFGASPPHAATPLIEREDDFRGAIDDLAEPTATFREVILPDLNSKKDGSSFLAVELEDAKLILRGEPRYVAADAGKNFDAFSLACAHGEEDANGNIITVYDWIVRLVTRNMKQEVYFESIFNLLKKLKDRMFINTIEFDHWNSTTIIQRLRNELGMFAQEAVTKPEHFIQFMRDVYGGQVRFLPPLASDANVDPPFMSAQGALIYELLHLERDPKNDKVYNPKKGLRKGWDSDDTARVAVHVHRMVQDQGFTKKQMDNSLEARRKRSEFGLAKWAAQGRGRVFNPSRGALRL